jgi:hypothetical protein
MLEAGLAAWHAQAIGLLLLHGSLSCKVRLPGGGGSTGPVYALVACFVTDDLSKVGSDFVSDFTAALNSLQLTTWQRLPEPVMSAVRLLAAVRLPR